VAYGRNNSRNQTSPSAEDGEEADHKLHSRKHKRDNESPVHPPRSFGISIHALVEVIPKQILHTRVLQPPHLHGVEVELEFARGAVCDLLFKRLRILVALAVGEEADLVEVLELFGAGYAAKGGCEVGVGDPVGKLVGDDIGVGRYIACVCLSCC
jgi:hypothetical protein